MKGILKGVPIEEILSLLPACIRKMEEALREVLGTYFQKMYSKAWFLPSDNLATESGNR